MSGVRSPLLRGVAALATLAAAVVLGIAVAGPAGAAGAQQGGGNITVLETHPSDRGVHYIIELTDAAGEPVTGAAVTAIPFSEDGTQGTPVTMTPASEPGVYQGSVYMSDGSWRITFSSSEPEATLDYEQEMPAEAAAGSSGSTGDEEGGGSALVLVVAGIVVVLLLAAGAWLLLSRRRPAEVTITPEP
jgi:hypothetical protein